MKKIYHAVSRSVSLCDVQYVSYSAPLCFHSPLALCSSAPPLLGDTVDLLELFLLVITECSCQTLVPSCVAALDP